MKSSLQLALTDLPKSEIHALLLALLLENDTFTGLSPYCPSLCLRQPKGSSLGCIGGWGKASIACPWLDFLLLAGICI